MAKHKVNAGDLEKAALAVVLLHDGSGGSSRDLGFALAALKSAVLGEGSGPIVPEHMKPDQKDVNDELDRIIARLEGDAEARPLVAERQAAAAEARHTPKSKRPDAVETHAAVSEIDTSKTPVAAPPKPTSTSTPVRPGAQSTADMKAQKRS